MARTLFDGLSLTAKTSRTLKHRLHDLRYCRDGTSSRVVITSERTVTKLTNCPATIHLLNMLSDAPVEGLPRVVRILGTIAIDKDEPSLPHFSGFELERLTHADGDGSAELVAEFVTKIKRQIAGRTFGFSSVDDAALALELSKADTHGLASAWRFLADFLLRHSAVLDAVKPRNVMLTGKGRLCLADAVSFRP